MRSKGAATILAILLGYWLALLPAAAGAAELSTLFTTPQERQVINANRYKSVDIEPVREAEGDEARKPEPAEVLVREEVTREYMISGITVARDGAHTAWINSLAYEDGGKLDDDSRIKIFGGEQVRVRITAPDGKHYYAASGETIKVTYMR